MTSGCEHQAFPFRQHTRQYAKIRAKNMLMGSGSGHTPHGSHGEQFGWFWWFWWVSDENSKFPCVKFMRSSIWHVTGWVGQDQGESGIGYGYNLRYIFRVWGIGADYLKKSRCCGAWSEISEKGHFLQDYSSRAADGGEHRAVGWGT